MSLAATESSAAGRFRVKSRTLELLVWVRIPAQANFLSSVSSSIKWITGACFLRLTKILTLRDLHIFFGALCMVGVEMVIVHT